MTLFEVGEKHTVSLVEDVDTAILYPGDIAEFYLIPDRTIDKYNALLAIKAAFKMKESYHNLVIHYLRIDKDKVTVQCSAAPPGATIGSPTTVQAVIVVTVCIAVIVAVVAFTLTRLETLKIERAKLLGSVSVNAKKCDNAEGTNPVSINAPFSFDSIAAGITPTTVKDLRQGDYAVTWGDYSGYQTPTPSRVTVVAGAGVGVTGLYYKQGVTPPTTGLLVIDTSGAPVKGEVYVDNEWVGKTPLSLVVSVGVHSISFGAIENYITPIMQTITVTPYPPDPTPVNGIYKPEEKRGGLPAWAKGAAVVGGTVLGVGIGIEVLRRLRRKK